MMKETEGGKMTEKELLGASLFISAGFETTANTCKFF